MTWKAAISLYVQNRGGTIIETGCQRLPEDWGAGCSTKLLALLLRELGFGELHSVDNSCEKIAFATTVLEADRTLTRVVFHLDDSVKFLKGFNRPVDFLYLDSYDYQRVEPELSRAQRHQLAEIEAIYDMLSESAVVLLDDNSLPGGGKTRLSKQFLYAHKWRCLLDWQQSLWFRGR